MPETATTKTTTKTKTKALKCKDCIWLHVPCGKGSIPCSSLHENKKNVDAIVEDTKACDSFVLKTDKLEAITQAMLGADKDDLAVVRKYVSSFMRSLDRKQSDLKKSDTHVGDLVQFDLVEKDDEGVAQTYTIKGRAIGVAKNTARVMDEEDGEIVQVYLTNPTLTTLRRGKNYKEAVKGGNGAGEAKK